MKWRPATQPQGMSQRRAMSEDQRTVRLPRGKNNDHDCCTSMVHAQRLQFDSRAPGDIARLGSVTDCVNLSHWANGTWKLFNGKYRAPWQKILENTGDVCDTGVQPPSTIVDWVTHVPRESNQEADMLAQRREDRCRLLTPLPWPPLLHIFCDGGCRRPLGRDVCGCFGARSRLEAGTVIGRSWRPRHLGPCQST